MKVLIGEIKENAKDGLDKLVGMKLIIANEIFEGKAGEVLILSPTSLEDFEKYYKHEFEVFGKEWISEDYKFFLEYVLDEDCEITNSTNINNFINLVAATKEDGEIAKKAMTEFKKKYSLDVNIEEDMKVFFDGEGQWFASSLSVEETKAWIIKEYGYDEEIELKESDLDNEGAWCETKEDKYINQLNGYDEKIKGGIGDLKLVNGTVYILNSFRQMLKEDGYSKEPYEISSINY